MAHWDNKRIITQLLSIAGNNIFDSYINELESYFNRRVSSIQEMKSRDDKKEKGSIWEQFCQLWLRHDCRYTDVWLFNEIPDDIRRQLKLGNVDYGIDMVARNYDGFAAIQCKYRSKNGKVTWNTLSTFIGLCSVTGPWIQQVVMTNCSGVTRKIPRGPLDKSICLGSFRGTKREKWLKMVDMYTETRCASSISPENPKIPEDDIEKIRQARLLYYQKI